jgi:ABC-2 type transport system permease protein
MTRLVSGFKADTTKPEGKEAYENATDFLSSNRAITLAAYKMPNSTAIFSIGQGDVFPYYYNVKVESFFMQLFKQTEIANPLRSLAGHFDVSFWIIYLLPLLIIVLGFNALSSELDTSNWRLINSQGIGAKAWLSSKFSFIGLLVGSLVLSVFMGGILVNYFHFQQMPTLNDGLFFVGVNLYLSIWLSIVYLVNSFAKTTATNALYCGIIWTIACIILPTIVTVLVEKIVPVDNTLVSRMSRRPQGSKFDDAAFGVATIKELGEAHPQYKNTSLNPENPAFRLAVYTAFHELNDDANAVEVKKYFSNIEQRQAFTNASCLFNPTAAIDGIFTGLAANDAPANHQFVWKTKALHEQLHDAYFPSLFLNKPLTEAVYKSFPIFKTSQNASIPLILGINYLFLCGLIVGFTHYGNKQLLKMGTS